MLGDNNGNAALPVFLDENRFRYPANGSTNQLQLFGNLSYGFNTDPVNYFGNEGNLILRPKKQRGREADGMSNQQKLQISLNSKIYHDEVDRTATIPHQNPVSTGLRLSYDDEERNSSVTSASGSMTVPSSIFWSLNDNIRTELDQQKEELEQYIKTQLSLSWFPTSGGANNLEKPKLISV